MPVIDVVYTWVNGSDPRWLERMIYFKAKIDDGINGADTAENKSGGGEPQGADDVAGVHRYRDNGELKYSLRSVEKYAPWVRRVFIVTDNQVPAWLDLSNPRVDIVSHEQIFPNVTALPSFSSPGIEASIHRIPGVAEHILYLNDDVMLGAPVMPTDFFTPSGGQKLYLAWDLPSCSEGCEYSWVGDGYCDAACNVAACSFDNGDCLNATDHGGYDAGFDGDHTWKSYDDEQEYYCSPSCPKSWLADGSCDASCSVASCLFDMFDCHPNMEQLAEFPRVYVQLDSTQTGIIRLPYGTEAIAIEYSKLGLNATDELKSVDLQRSSLIARSVVNIENRLLLIILRRQQASSDVSAIWGGPSVCGYERLNGICYSQMKAGLRLSSCSKTFGCERKRALQDALHLCSIRGEECDGVTEDHDGQFQTRTGQLLFSSLGENSWTKEQCPASDAETMVPREGCRFNATAMLPTKTLAFRLSFALGGQRVYRLTGALEDTSTNSDTGSSSTRRLEGLVESANIRHLVTSIRLNESDDLGNVLSGASENSLIRRLDTFGDSLRHVNGVYTRAFGHSVRRVPAHMPHFLQREEIKRMQERFAREFEATRFHRFRSNKDMQFSFAYMYWLVQQSSQPEMSLDEFFRVELDVDKDGKLNANELRTMVAVAAGSEDLETTLPDMMSQVEACLDHSEPAEMTLDQFKSCDVAGKMSEILWFLSCDNLVLMYSKGCIEAL